MFFFTVYKERVSIFPGLAGFSCHLPGFTCKHAGTVHLTSTCFFVRVFVSNDYVTYILDVTEV